VSAERARPSIANLFSTTTLESGAPPPAIGVGAVIFPTPFCLPAPPPPGLVAPVHSPPGGGERPPRIPIVFFPFPLSSRSPHIFFSLLVCVFTGGCSPFCSPVLDAGNRPRPPPIPSPPQKKLVGWVVPIYDPVCLDPTPCMEGFSPLGGWNADAAPSLGFLTNNLIKN